MKNSIKFIQALILVILWGGAAAQNLPVNNDASDVAAPGTSAPMMYTPAPADALPLDVLFDNGPAFNSAGTGAGGADESIVSAPLNTFGFGCQQNLGNHVADDFIVPPGDTWNVTSIDFFSYQTGSTTASTFTGVYVRIWNGRPGDPGSIVVWGDDVTNVMGTNAFSNIYRVQAPNGGTFRPIMKVSANTAGLSLATGSYWVEWALTGTLASGPWAPPLVPGTDITGNAVQMLTNSGVYTDLVSPSTGPPFYAQGLPFVINGTHAQVNIPTLSTWGLILMGMFILGVGVYFGVSRMS